MRMGEGFLGPPGLMMLAAILGAIGALWASHQKSRFEQELRERSEETIRTITGGDSFAYLDLAALGPGDNSAILLLIHEGDYPLYDLHVRLLDVQKFNQIKGSISLQKLASAETNMNVGTVVAGFAQTRGPFDLGSGNERDFNVSFTARNGGFHQELRFRRVGNQWVRATRVTRGATNPPLLQIVDPNYPRNADGGIDW